MNKLLFATLALVSFALPSQAGVLLPNIYASEYCSMREAGVSVQQSMEVAVKAAYIEGTAIKVTINGEQYDADVIQANIAVRDRCPQYM